MNGFLSGFIDVALNYVTPLPMPEEGVLDMADPEDQGYQDLELPYPEIDIGMSYDVGVETFPTSSDVTVLDKLKDCNVNGENTTQELSIITDFSVKQSDAISNVDIEIVAIPDETLNAQTDFVGLQQCTLPKNADTEHNNPLTNLLKTPSDEKGTKVKRKRRSKLSKICDEKSKNQCTEGPKKREYGFDIMHENAKPLTQDEACVIEESLESFQSISPMALQNSDNSVNPSPVSDVKTVDKPEVKKKRSRKRDINPDRTPPPQILPPCKICDEKSSGFHYGAYTCEACKGFFRRTLKKKEVNFQCKCTEQDRESWKRGPFKNGCPACRYERCLEMGMSKNAIKIGRYTLGRKTENIKEVKSLEAMDTIIQDAITEATNASSSDPQDTSQFLQGLHLNSPEDMSTIDMTAFSAMTEVNTPSPTKKPRSDIEEDSIDLSSPDVFRKGGMTLKEIDTMVKTLVDANNKYKVLEPRAIDQDIIRQRKNRCLERHALKTALFGKMSSLSFHEFMEVYKTTGIELDDRLKEMEKSMKFFESRISVIVSYAKCIPGFKELDLDDQANLIKASRVESLLISGYQFILTGIDLENKVVVTPWGPEYHMDDMGKIIPKEYTICRREMASAMQNLDLTIQEESVMRAIAITFTDRRELNSPEVVEQIQYKLLTCLEHLLSVRPGGQGNKLYKIFDLLANLRHLTEHQDELSKKMFLDWPNLFSNYHLLSEFLR